MTNIQEIFGPHKKTVEPELAYSLRSIEADIREREAQITHLRDKFEHLVMMALFKGSTKADITDVTTAGPYEIGRIINKHMDILIMLYRERGLDIDELSDPEQ